MPSLVTSSDFFFLVMTLAAVGLYVWKKRQLKKASAEQWKIFHAACTTSTRKTAEAAWITALRTSVARDGWKRGLKPSAVEAQVQSHPSYCEVPGHAESRARRVADPEVVWVHCKSGDSKIAKLQHWLSEGKTLFTVIVFLPADHEWEKIHEGQGLLEEVTEQEAKFRFNGANPWMFFPDFSIGYDRKRKRPLIQFRERL